MHGRGPAAPASTRGVPGGVCTGRTVRRGRVGHVNVDLDRPPVDRPLLDPAVWERTETRRALAARDLAAVFRLLRKAGTSQRTIATLTGLAPSEVYEIGRGRRVMAYDVLFRVAGGPGVPRGHPGLAYGSQTAPLVRPPPPGPRPREQGP